MLFVLFITVGNLQSGGPCSLLSLGDEGRKEKFLFSSLAEQL